MGHFICWINSDDLFLRGIENSVKVVIENNYKWINGKSSYMKNGRVYSVHFSYYFSKFHIRGENVIRMIYTTGVSYIFRDLCFKSGFWIQN